MPFELFVLCSRSRISLAKFIELSGEFLEDGLVLLSFRQFGSDNLVEPVDLSRQGFNPGLEICDRPISVFQLYDSSLE